MTDGQKPKKRFTTSPVGGEKWTVVKRFFARKGHRRVCRAEHARRSKSPPRPDSIKSLWYVV